MRKLWGGAFEGNLGERAERFGQSIADDLRMWRWDVIASIEHVRMLRETGILSPKSASKLIAGLKRILREGEEKLPRDVEDVHTAIEIRLAELVGAEAGNVHIARSRNDQVVTAFRLWLRERLGAICHEIKALQAVLVDLSRRHAKSVMPGYTHQQVAQPITLGFHLLAHFWALQRDGWRFERVGEELNYSPLGSGALAGTTFAIDRHSTSEALGFRSPMPNALDATTDRSFVLDTLNACAQVMLTLGRIGQELVLWSGSEYGFVRLDDSVTTGSSIMPQKRNPDMAELIRGRGGRAIGNWVAVATMLKGLVTGYSRDLQDDKPATFESVELVCESLALIRSMLDGAKWDTDRMARQATRNFAVATAIADELTRSGMTFRQAHEAVGRIARALSVSGRALTAAEVKRLAPEVPDPELVLRLLELDPGDCVRLMESPGGTGPRAVARQWRLAQRTWLAPGFRKPM
jgi:argininosuccinate lyase